MNSEPIAAPLPTGTRKRLHMDEITPYWRNPRRISDEAVNALAKSLSDYEYQQPIVVDGSHVIIVGHTRYAALRRLGYTHVDVLVADHLTPMQAREWRVIDNRTSELNEWDYDKLAEELSLSDDRLAGFFPEFSAGPALPEGDQSASSPITPEDDEQWDEDDLAANLETAEFVCPHCFHLWETRVTHDMLRAGRIPAAGDPNQTQEK